MIEQTRTGGNTKSELEIRTGKPAGDGRAFVEGVVDASSAATTAFEIRHDGTYWLQGTQVLGARQAAIADSAGGDEQDRINAILGALRSHGLIAT